VSPIIRSGDGSRRGGWMPDPTQTQSGSRDLVKKILIRLIHDHLFPPDLPARSFPGSESREQM
jgi:hypothetical protein